MGTLQQQPADQYKNSTMSKSGDKLSVTTEQDQDPEVVQQVWSIKTHFISSGVMEATGDLMTFGSTDSSTSNGTN